MTDVPPSLATALMGIGELFDQIIEALNGYRTKLEAAGYSSAVIDIMVTDYHRLLLDLCNPFKRRPE